MRHVYLHGFASGPQSRKAQAFRNALLRAGVAEVEIPDLAAGDFEHLTISSQLGLLERELANEPVRLIGSSMGGYLAALYAARHAAVERLVLLAPAFQFPVRWAESAGPEKMRAWKESGWLEVYHYADQQARRVHYGLYEDALRYEPNPDFAQPARIYHGVNDGTVPIGYSREFAAEHPNAVLQELDSDHELLNVLDWIVADAVPFLAG